MWVAEKMYEYILGLKCSTIVCIIYRPKTTDVTLEQEGNKLISLCVELHSVCK